MPTRRNRRFVAMPAAIVLVLAIFLVAALQAYLGQEGFRLSRLESEVKVAEEQSAVLRSEVARLSSPARIAEQSAKLGLVADPNPIFLQVPGAP